MIFLGFWKCEICGRYAFSFPIFQLTVALLGGENAWICIHFWREKL